MLGLRVLLLQGSGLCALLLLIGGEKLPPPAAIIHACIAALHIYYLDAAVDRCRGAGLIWAFMGDPCGGCGEHGSCVLNGQDPPHCHLNGQGDCVGRSPPAVEGTYCAPLPGACYGPGESGSSTYYINGKRGYVSNQTACESGCTAEPMCVGYFYIVHDSTYPGYCEVYGPGIANTASSPWTGLPHSITTIYRASGNSDSVCVAVAGRNSAH
eukprot:COSAG01_NODE_664_length_14417_cov_18.499022_14_plen_212_part_00